jgi:uncharacterized protein (TIGR02598 family)
MLRSTKGESPLRSVAAFSLIEVTLALGVAGFCLIAVFGLMPIGVQTNRNATSQTAATNIVAAVVADLRATPKANATSAQFGITFGTCKNLYFDSQAQVAATSDCGNSITLPATARYQLNVTWAGTSGLRYAGLKVTWPPTVVLTSPTPIPSGSVEMVAALDRN